jgi:hypothetical protein
MKKGYYSACLSAFGGKEILIHCGAAAITRLNTDK